MLAQIRTSLSHCLRLEKVHAGMQIGTSWNPGACGLRIENQTSMLTKMYLDLQSTQNVWPVIPRCKDTGHSFGYFASPCKNLLFLEHSSQEASILAQIRASGSPCMPGRQLHPDSVHRFWSSRELTATD